MKVIPQSDSLVAEITYVSLDRSISNMTVGFFPSKGRYFRREMSSKDGVFYTTSVQVPSGKLFYHLFADQCFTEPIAGGPEIISAEDPLKRFCVNYKTDVFCPLIHFDSISNYDPEDDTLEIRVITQHGFIGQLHLIAENDTSFALRVVYENRSTKYWYGKLPVSQIGRQYLLQIEQSNSVKFFHRNKEFSPFPLFQNGFPVPRKPAGENNTFSDWNNKIGYQIFPDRFARTSNKVAVKKLLQWDEDPGHYTYHGGDLMGMIDKLDYLKVLQIDFLYLNPIVHARNSHRYDVIDYLKVDPILGDEKTFKTFVDRAHELEIKVVLDIPVNHCSTAFFAFEDVLQNQEKSAYVNWFEIDRFPVTVQDNPPYSCWCGYKEYPQFNFDEPEVISYFFEVTRYWIESFDIDGWRLDSSTELPYEFVQELVSFSRGLKQGLLVIGENWHNDFGLLDYGANGITNYGLYWDVLIPFFKKSGSVSQLAYNIMEHFHANPYHQKRFCWNFLSNHDIPRFYSIVSNKSHYPMALTLMFCLPGTPVLYYGEELCMEGGQDPLNRKGMKWDKVAANEKTIRWIKQLIGLRKAYDSFFVHGTLSIPFVSNVLNTFVISRSIGQQSLFFVFNFSNSEVSLHLNEFTNSKQVEETISRSRVEQCLTLMPCTCQILYGV